MDESALHGLMGEDTTLGIAINGVLVMEQSPPYTYWDWTSLSSMIIMDESDHSYVEVSLVWSAGIHRTTTAQETESFYAVLGGSSINFTIISNSDITIDYVLPDST